jgi:glycosyltransferase involved in cell wall biosynthesis
MQPLISVIVAVYKVEPFLKKCIDSLLNQTYSNYEIILVDDGSPDNCPDICDDYEKRHSNIRTFHKENGGLSSARNYGVIKSTSNWIAFVDSDDYVENTYLEDLWNLHEKYKSDISIIRIVREREDGKGKPFHRVYEDYCVDNKQAIFEAYNGQHIGWSAPGKLIKREHLIEHPFPNGFYEDCACMYKIIDMCKVVAIGDYQNDYHYIQRDGSILKSNLDRRHLHIFEICKEFQEYINEKYSDLDILPVLMYRRGITQLLNLQAMPWKTYCELFNTYKPYFRKNIGIILKSENVNIKTKILTMMLCTSPLIFKAQRMILEKTNHR